MKRFNLLAIIFALSLLLTGFQDPDSKTLDTSSWRTGTVLSSMNTGSYVYIELETEEGTVWVAAPSTSVKPGDMVSTSIGIEMHDHYSKTLKRTFPVIHFVTNIKVGGSGHKDDSMNIGKGKTASYPSKGSIKKAEGGHTLKEIFAERESLGGTTVTVRAKVVKTTGFIMKRNWLHIQDGTGDDKNLDLIVTSSDTADAGDTVLVTGTLNLDRDFGMGYKYETILEDSKIVVESPE